MGDNSEDSDYEQRLRNIRKAIGEFNPTVEAIEENMRLIGENKDNIRQLSMKDPDDTYIQLHHSKHKDFADLLVKLHDINKNLDKYKAAREAQTLDVPKLKAFLQQQKTVFKDNLRAVNELESCIGKLDSFGESEVHTTKEVLSA